MILLGAGASKAFGIKTLQEMTDDLIRILKENGHEDSVNRIVKNLEKYGLKTDFEAIYTIVQGMIDLNQTMKVAGPLTAYVCADSTPFISQDECKKILYEFKEFLLKACQPDSSAIDKIHYTYSDLFRLIFESTFNAHEAWRSGKAEAVTIVTTNYDMILEQYFWHTGKSFADGFIRKIEQPHIRELDTEEFRRDHLKSQTYWLIKLHGSIWMYKYKNKIFKTSVEPSHSPIPVKIEEEMMIFPVKEKPILEYPYYEFYDLFRKEQWDELLVIGYSFRDEPVNCAIMDNLRRLPTSIIIIFDPDAETLASVIYSTYNIAYDRIIPVKGKFGDWPIGEDLKTALKCSSRTIYEKELKERERRAKIEFK
jgi:hypothetical protein